MKVAVVGLGYVGTVTAACLASNGHDVWGVDTDAFKIDEIRSGRSPVAEPGLDAIVAQTVAGRSLRATTDCAEALESAEISLVCVGTPSAARGATDLVYIRHAVSDIVAAFRTATSPRSGMHSVVVRSTVPPGTVQDVVGPMLAAGSARIGLSFGAAMCPEFLREGCGVQDFYNPPFIVVGTGNVQVAESVISLFRFLDRQVEVVDVRVAEALKYACNAFHATKVSFTNEVARLLRLLDVDARLVMALFCQDNVLNISPSYLRPGFAFGGSCLPKDLRSLLYQGRINGVDLPLLASTLVTNELSISEVVDRVVAHDARRVALLGLSFKANTDDLRESPNVELAERLIGKGFEVRIYDQVINPARLMGANRRYVESKLPHLEGLLAHDPAEALAGADLAVVTAGEPAVVAALCASAPPHVIDLNGRLGACVEALPGYEGLGW